MMLNWHRCRRKAGTRRIIAQALMGAVDSTSTTSACGMVLASSSWSAGQQYALSVMGTQDGKRNRRDAMQTRDVSLVVAKYSSGTETCRKQFGTAQVVSL